MTDNRLVIVCGALATLCLAFEAPAEPRRPCVEGSATPTPERALPVTSVDPGSSSIAGDERFNLAYPHRQAELLVFPKQGGPPPALELPTWTSLWESVGATDVRFDPFVPMYTIKLPLDVVLDDVAHRLLSDGDKLIRSVQANSCVFPGQASSEVLPLVATGLEDPKSKEQWGHWMIGLEQAWGTTTGTSSVVVAIMDSGINHNNADLACNFWVNSCEIANNTNDLCPGQGSDGMDDDLFGWNFVDWNNQLVDNAHHGTVVAGIIGACRNSIGVVGVNWSVSLMDLRLWSTVPDAASLGHALNAIAYGVRNGAQVINASWSSYPSEELKQLILRAADVIVITSAGDRKPDGKELKAPDTQFPCMWAGELPNVICVTSTTQGDEKTQRANFGEVVQIAAPGEGIVSTEGTGTGGGSGTSFSAPYVAGVVALLKAQFPALSTGEIVESVQCGDDVPKLSGMTQPGTTPGTGRRLNAAKALACAAAASTSSPP